MKLDRLPTTTRSPSAEAQERGLAAAAGERRVEAMEGAEPDRERTLQQELAAVDPRAFGRFAGGKRLLEEARDVAARVAGLGDQASDLLQADVLAGRRPHCDDNA